MDPCSEVRSVQLWHLHDGIVGRMGCLVVLAICSRCGVRVVEFCSFMKNLLILAEEVFVCPVVFLPFAGRSSSDVIFATFPYDF